MNFYIRHGGNEMELTPEIAALGTELATIAGKKSVETIFDKINAVKKKENKDEIIRNLEEIVNELISDKNSLIRISQAYEQELVAQKITDKEIEYIADSIIPLLEKLIKESNPGASAKVQNGINIIKPILSKETFNILQILGFNFKQAIGEPMTEFIGSLIRSKVNDDKKMELQILEQKRTIEYLKVCQNKEAYDRLTNMQ